MRPREEIEKIINQRPPKNTGTGDELIIEVLLDIRALLSQKANGSIINIPTNIKVESKISLREMIIEQLFGINNDIKKLANEKSELMKIWNGIDHTYENRTWNQ